MTTNKSEPSAEESYTLTEQYGSYVNILRNGVAWLGSVEHTIAREIVRKLNDQEKLSARIKELEAAPNLLNELLTYVSNGKYGLGWEFNIQCWASMYTIYIQKDDVEMTSFSRDTIEETLACALDYLKRIKAKKPKD